jgi:hypothetical protein
MPGGADRLDNWNAPGNARGDSYPDDRIALAAPATPRMAQPTPGPRPASAIPAPPIDRGLCPIPSQPTGRRSRPAISGRRGTRPSSRMRLGNICGRRPRRAPPVVPALGLLAGLADLQPATPEAASSGGRSAGRLPRRRKCGYVTPVPKARKQRQGGGSHAALDLGAGTDAAGQAYGVARITARPIRLIGCGAHHGCPRQRRGCFRFQQLAQVSEPWFIVAPSPGRATVGRLAHLPRAS